MKVDASDLELRVIYEGACLREIGFRYGQVDIPEEPRNIGWIITSGSPAFDQYRLDAILPKRSKGVDDVIFRTTTVQYVEAEFIGQFGRHRKEKGSG
jgi:hypothetical protein